MEMHSVKKCPARYTVQLAMHPRYIKGVFFKIYYFSGRCLYRDKLYSSYSIVASILQCLQYSSFFKFYKIL